MRRLVAISNKTSTVIMLVAVLTITLTSIHLAAAARIASLRREQERLEQMAVSAQPATPSIQPSALSQNPSPEVIQTANPKLNGAAAAEQQATTASLSRGSGSDTKKAAMAVATVAHRRQIVISIADRKLAVMENGQVLKVYPIAVGTRGTPSPDGDFLIINRAKDPTYRHRDKEIAPGKDNPLGTRWMGLSLKGYGIHGTNVQSSVGKAASHGCFRMHRQDVEELYTMVQVGDAVTVRRERDATIAQVFAAPSNTPAAVTAKAESNAEVQVASASATTTAVEATEQ